MWGSYELFDAMSNDLGSRAFAWSISGGFIDLGNSVFGGLGPNGWGSLNTNSDMLPDGSLVGVGLLSDMTTDQMGYLLVAVPEVSTVVSASCLVCIGIATWWLFRQRSNRWMEKEVLAEGVC